MYFYIYLANTVDKKSAHLVHWNVQSTYINLLFNLLYKVPVFYCFISLPEAICLIAYFSRQNVKTVWSKPITAFYEAEAIVMSSRATNLILNFERL